MTKVLVTGNWGKDEIVEYAIEPFIQHAASFKQDGYDITLIPSSTFEEVANVVEEQNPDIAMIGTDWKYSAEETIEFFKNLRSRHPNLPIGYMDNFDQSSTPFFGILPYVDKYIKKQWYKDLSNYRKDYRGGFIFADFTSHHYDIDPGEGGFGSYLPEEYESKLLLSPHLATFKDIRRFVNFSRYARHFPIRKDIDINCRVSVGDEKNSWYYYRHRVESLQALEAMGDRYNVVTNLKNKKRMGFKAFIYEVARSKIGFSPFGWGEVTYRDYYAIGCDTLMVKPDMSHLETVPDIFRDGETYVAVKWDLSDLEEKCIYYLEHPNEAREITQNARAVLESFYKDRKDYYMLKGILDALAACSASSTSQAA